MFSCAMMRVPAFASADVGAGLVPVPVRVEQRMDALLPGALSHEREHILGPLSRAAIHQQHTLVRMEHHDVAATTRDNEQALAELRHGERRAICWRPRAGRKRAFAAATVPIVRRKWRRFMACHLASPCRLSDVSATLRYPDTLLLDHARTRRHRRHWLHPQACARRESLIVRSALFATSRFTRLVAAATRGTVKCRATVVRALIDVRAGIQKQLR